MSGHGRPASPDFACEIHVASGDERTSVHDAEPDTEPHSSWISEKDWNNYIREAPRVRIRPPSVVSIFRVPKLLKDTKKEAYVPQRVSLGPHHHGSAEVRPMGHHKGRALRRMMERFNTNRNVASYPNNMDFAGEEIQKLENEIRNQKLEKEIRDSYEENIDCDGETLARMLILDGCFILEVLRALVRDEAVEYYEPIFWGRKLKYAAYDILYDILMLENQVPLIVLRKLLEFEINSAVDVEQQLFDLENQLLDLFYPFDYENFDIKQSKFDHLLGFLHTVVVSPPVNRVDQDEHSISIECCIRQCIGILPCKNKARDETKSIPCAVELRNVGIQFKRCNGGIKKIKFDEDSATIFLPPLCIQDNTEIVFRNLIALEMCKPSDINYVACYVNLMDNLIDSQEDVALLRRMGVLTSMLGTDKAVAQLFNGICKDVTLNMEYVFDKLTKKVNAHYKNKMKVQIAELVRDHFSSPWKALALASAIGILSLTVVQTIFSIIKG